MQVVIQLAIHIHLYTVRTSGISFNTLNISSMSQVALLTVRHAHGSNYKMRFENYC